jgi:hypothetical protein
MNSARKNAPLFIAAFYDACETLRVNNTDFYIPDAPMINGILAKHGVEFEVRPPNLVARDSLAIAIEVPTHAPSLDDQAQEIIQLSLQQSERLLSERKSLEPQALMTSPQPGRARTESILRTKIRLN